MRTWLHAPGGVAFQSALAADSAMRAALASGNQAKAAGAAPRLNSAARHAGSFALPTCSDGKPSFTVAMADWVTGARDAMNGNLTKAATEIASGAREIAATTALNELSPAALRLLAQRVSIPAPPAPTVVPTTQAPVTAPASAPTTTPPAPPATPAPTTASAAPAGCHPLSNEGTCYEPGEYCRDDDHGVSGVAGDGEAIICEDNDGWRWEPA